MDIVGKFEYEVFPVETDFSNVLETGESIIKDSSNVSVYTDDSNETDCTSQMVVNGSIDVIGNRLMAKIKAGTEGQIYQVKFQTVTDANNKYQHVVRLVVLRDRG